MARKYTPSKVLYLASTGKPLNVSISERADTDLSRIVRKHVAERLLVEVGFDDADRYYKLTTRGWIKHLQNRITQRNQMGKCTEKLERQLAIAEGLL